MKTLHTSILIILLASLSLQAQLVTYELHETDPFANTGATSSQAQPVPATSPYGTVAANIDSASLSFGAGKTADQRGGSFWNDTYGFIDWVDADLATAIAADNYISLTVNAASGFQMNLTQLDFIIGTTPSGGSVDWAVRTSVDNFASNIASGTSSNPTGTPTPSTPQIVLSGHNNLTTVEFRLYGWGATDSGSPSTTVRMAIGAPASAGGVSDVSLTGTVSPIPEPSSYAAILGVLVLTCVRFVHRQRC